MRRRRPLKTVRAIESNAGVTSAYARELKRAYDRIRREFIEELIKNVDFSNKKIAFDAVSLSSFNS